MATFLRARPLLANAIGGSNTDAAMQKKADWNNSRHLNGRSPASLSPITMRRRRDQRDFRGDDERQHYDL
jgi:hypothetical protein